MSVITNPILPGFHPDPSILRVGDDYYIATSTFEWFPGVTLHHSRDLVQWRQLPSPLTRRSQLDMIGDIDSGGVWAPCLSYAHGRFFLIYTDVKSRRGAFKDTHNYLVSAERIEGPWSDPVYLNSSGFDPSLFHDDDGTAWLLNMIWDFRKGRNAFAGIALQCYDIERQSLTGPVHNIFQGTSLGVTEAPHLYRRNGYYYLVTAEGGTGYGHAMTMARSRNLTGPYEVDPTNPVLTSDPGMTDQLQKAGHGSLVETQHGDWYLAHLCARPVVEKRCILGRETALQRCHWTEDGWLRVDHGPFPSHQVPAPGLEWQPPAAEADHDTFDGPRLKHYWHALRRPFSPDWLSLEECPGCLRLKGGESMQSTHRQSLLARRLSHFHVEVETRLSFSPVHFQQMAGLIVYYDTKDHVYLRVTHDEASGRCIGIIVSRHGQYDEPLAQDIPLEAGSVRLKARIDRQWLRFSFSTEHDDWQDIGEALDISHLCDDDPDYIRFTGTFVGLCAQDLSGGKLPADFHYFDYRPDKSDR
ncbi:glycoside hydrolase family 43 protein [Salinicola peritrichatus]|uniref:glycoside hydrolase family 43 protein n=1 Tax=Salinicola peritrichatus TaxID=1267424 RepID=UPI000DA1479C|nr:glycoside hydrolase family 43 protein [Salinicola peritrichatus]